MHRGVWAICLATWVPAMLAPEAAWAVASEVLGKFKAEVDALKQAFNTHAPKKVRDRINNTSAMGMVSPN